MDKGALESAPPEAETNMRKNHPKTVCQPSHERRGTLVDHHVGNRLRTIREEQRMSQETLGQHVDVTFQQIQKYERGANRISASRLHEFSSVLKVPVASFFTGLKTGVTDNGDARSVVDGLATFARSAEGSQLIAAFGKISDGRVRRQILRMIQVLTDSDRH